MLIRVTYSDDGSFDYVKDFRLDELISQRAISRFQRSTGWVDIMSEPIRQRRSAAPYDGVERRKVAR